MTEERPEGVHPRVGRRGTGRAAHVEERRGERDGKPAAFFLVSVFEEKSYTEQMK